MVTDLDTVELELAIQALEFPRGHLRPTIKQRKEYTRLVAEYELKKKALEEKWEKWLRVTYLKTFAPSVKDATFRLAWEAGMPNEYDMDTDRPTGYGAVEEYYKRFAEYARVVRDSL